MPLTILTNYHIAKVDSFRSFTTDITVHYGMLVAGGGEGWYSGFVKVNHEGYTFSRTFPKIVTVLRVGAGFEKQYWRCHL